MDDSKTKLSDLKEMGDELQHRVSHCNSDNKEEELEATRQLRQKVYEASLSRIPKQFAAALQPIEPPAIIVPSRDFYQHLIVYKALQLPKKPEKIFQAIKPLFHAVLCFTHPHFLHQFAEIIARVPKDCVQDLIDKLFSDIDQTFKASDPQCAQKFGNVLTFILGKITENECDGKPFDLVRDPPQTSAQVALKNIFIKVLFSDDAAQNIYKPVLYPQYNAALVVLFQDHCRQVYVENQFSTKSLNLKQIDDHVAHPLSKDAETKLESFAYSYMSDTGMRPATACMKIWPSGLKGVFTNFMGALQRLSSPTATNAGTVTVTLIDGKQIEIKASDIGELASFGSMCVHSIFHRWIKELEDKIRIETIFDNPMPVKESLKALLFDPDFYLSSLSKLELTEAQLSTYITACNKRWRQALEKTLENAENEKNDENEKQLLKDVKDLLRHYEDKNVLSRGFESEFTACILKCNYKIIAERIRPLLDNEVVKAFVEAVSRFEFSKDHQEKTREITFLFNALMTNNPDILSQLFNQEFVKTVNPFLQMWGVKLQGLLQQKLILTIITTFIEYGMFKEKIAEKLQKKFALPIALGDLSRMREGLLEFPDKELVDFCRGFANDTKAKQALKIDIVHDLLNNAKSHVIHQLESFMLDPGLLSAHFDILPSSCNEAQKKIASSAQAPWKAFVNMILQLIQSADFHGCFKKQWKDSNFEKQLRSIALNPAIYQKYDPFVSYLFFNIFKKKLNKIDHQLLILKARAYIEDVYDSPNKGAAQKIRGGNTYEVGTPTASDSCIKRFSNRIKQLGANGKIKDHLGEEILFRDAFVRVQVSFVDFDKIGEMDCSHIALAPPQNIQMEGKTYLESEVSALLRFVGLHTADKSDEEKALLWGFMLQLAIQHGDKPTILACLNLMKPYMIKPYLEKLVERALASNDSQLFSAVKECKEEVESLAFNTIQECTLFKLKSCINTVLPDGKIAKFLMWILGEKGSLFEDYLRVTSITETIKLQIAQFEKIVPLDHLLKVAPALGTLNVYVATKVFPDQFALGLADHTQEHSIAYQQRKAGLKAFNTNMITMLKNPAQLPTIELPADLANFSTYKNSLTPDAMPRFVEAYVKKFDDAAMPTAIEYSFAPMMTLNVHSCRALLQTLKTSKLYPLLVESLIARYSGLNMLLEENYKKLACDELCDLGKKTMLVAPALTFCIAVLDQAKPIANLQAVIDDGSLKNALDTAALLIRLQNDIGTIPLLKPIESLNVLKKQQNSHDFLTQLINTRENVWTRIVKSIKQGKYNVGVDNVRDIIQDAPKAWKHFESNIHYFSKVYLEEKEFLCQKINKLDIALGDKTLGQMIINFVLFHEKLYINSAKTPLSHKESLIKKNPTE